jgi:tyrosyl-tRNA synthetase
VGGATASVGDPTGRTSSRIQQSDSARNANTKAIRAQLSGLEGTVSRLARQHLAQTIAVEPGAWKLEDNDRWLQKTSIMEVLSTIGNGLRLGPLLGRDT